MESLKKIVYSTSDELVNSGILDSGNLEHYSGLLSKICDSTNAFITIHDLKKLRVAYINEACKSFYGLKQNVISGFDTAYYVSTFHPRTLDLLVKSYNFFFESNGIGDLKMLYSLKHTSGNYMDVLGHTITCIRENDKPRYALTASYYAERLNDLYIKKSDCVSVQLLSKRELEILELIYNNKDKHQIAEELFISVETVRTHRKNLMKKLNVTTIVELIKRASDILLIK